MSDTPPERRFTREWIVSGVKWSTVSQIGRQAITFCAGVVLARLLPPSDFGLLGMATVVTGFVFLFNDLGITAAVVQQRGISQDLLSSLYWVSLGFGLAMAIALFLAAPLFSGFYREPGMTVLLRALSPAFLFTGAGAIQRALLERELAIERVAGIEILAISIGAACAVGMALAGAGVWSLVAQCLVPPVLTTALLWRATDWRPRAIFRAREVRSVAGFGINLVGFNVVNFFARNADYLLIGRYLGAEALGYYSLAYRLMITPLQNISSAIGRVLFPLLSRVREDPERIRRAYLKAAGASSLVSFPMMLGVMALSRPFVATVFGPRWEVAGRLLEILAPIGMIQSISTLNGNLYLATGNTGLQFKVGAAFSLVITAGFVAGLPWGIEGIAVSYVVTTLLVLYPAFRIPFRMADLRLSSLLAEVGGSFSAAMIMLTLVLAGRFLLPPDLPEGWVLLILVPAGAAVYFLATWILNRDQFTEMVDLLLGR